MAYPHQDLRFGSPESDMMMREDTFESLQNNECVSPPPSDSFPDEYDVGGVRYLVPPRYSHLAYVGAGSFGNVCKAQDALVKGWVAIKKLPWRAPGRTTPEQHWRYLLREAELLVHFRLAQAWEVAGMENIIVHAHAHDALYFVMPLMACSLRDAFEVNPQDFASHSNVMGIMHNLLTGVHCLQSAGVIHRDIKPDNLLFDEDNVLHIGDFGEARGLPQSSNEALTGYKVTRWYRAPEIVMGDAYTPTVDIWAVGCVFAEMLAVGMRNTSRKKETVLFWTDVTEGAGPRKHMRSIFSVLGHNPTDDFSGFASTNVRDFLRSSEAVHSTELVQRFGDGPHLHLLRKLLQFDPNARPTAAEALAMEYFGEDAWTDPLDAFDVPTYIPTTVPDDLNGPELEVWVRAQLLRQAELLRVGISREMSKDLTRQYTDSVEML